MKEPRFDNEKIKYEGDSFERSSSTYIFGFIGKILLLIIVGIPVVQFLFNNSVNIFDLNSILHLFENAPSIDMSWFSKLVNNGIPGLDEEWAILDGFRIFLSYLVDSVLFVAWLVTGLINCITFFSYFIINMISA